MSEEIPNQWSHSVKLEETAKGIRISVHVYGNDEFTTLQGAVSTYLKTQKECRAYEIPLAPMEIVEKK